MNKLTSIFLALTFSSSLIINTATASETSAPKQDEPEISLLCLIYPLCKETGQ